MKRKSALSKFNGFLCIVLAVLILATAYVINKYPVIEQVTEQTSNEDVAVIDAFEAGTYGGVEFGSIEDVVAYYNEAYDYTKTLTATYIHNGETKTYYKLIGDENLNVSNLLVEGKSNSMLDNLVPGIVGGLFTGGSNGLTPSGAKDPEYDTRNDGALDCRKSMLVPEDVLEANVVDNGDGTITMAIQPKAVILSMPGEDAQGHMFNSLGDISSVVNSISVLSFSQGTIDENFVVNYAGGTATVVIDTKTKEIIKADYLMHVHIDVSHANVAVLKDKSASLDIDYDCHYPIPDDKMAEQGLSRK